MSTGINRVIQVLSETGKHWKDWEKEGEDSRRTNECGSEKKISQEWNWKMKVITGEILSRPWRIENRKWSSVIASCLSKHFQCVSRFFFFMCEPLQRRDWSWKMTQQESHSKFFAQMMWWHHDWQCCTLQVFLYRARIRTMSRFHTDVSREPGLNNWCWCHYSQASVYVCWWKKWPCCTGTIGQRFSLPLHTLGQ